LKFYNNTFSINANFLTQARDNSITRQILIERASILPLDAGVNNPDRIITSEVSSAVYLTDNHLIT